MKRLLPGGAILGLASASAVRAQPILQQRWPAANAVAAAPTGSVWAAFEPAPSLLVHASPLWVYSAQRGGLRTGHSGPLQAAGRVLTFRPAYPFQPGEVLYATTWAASAANQPARPQLWQFTTAVGGTGQGNFLPGTDLPTPNLAPGVVLGDVDNDGDLDLLTASTSASQVRVRLNGGNASGAGTGQYDAGTLVEVGHPAYSLALGDVDGDGDLDLVTTSFTAGTVSVRLNGGDASGTNTGRFGGGAEVPVGSQPQRLSLVDVDHDGDLDLLATCTGAGTVSVRLNGGDALGAGTGRFSGGSDPAVGAAPVGLALADVDRDGDLDLLTTSPAASQVSLRLNHPWVQPVAAPSAASPDSSRSGAPACWCKPTPARRCRGRP